MGEKKNWSLLWCLQFKWKSLPRSVCQFSNKGQKNGIWYLTMRIIWKGTFHFFSWTALKSPQCDQVMEFSWSALWNITDETPDNCQMFLNCRGMSLFLECLQVSHLTSLLWNLRQLPSFQDYIRARYSFRWNIICLAFFFLSLPQEFPDKQELHRNMLGLLGNVAEVKALRPQLLTPQFIIVFRWELLKQHK